MNDRELLAALPDEAIHEAWVDFYHNYCPGHFGLGPTRTMDCPRPWSELRDEDCHACWEKTLEA